ncbi:hypothetical protein Tsp_10989 [Trichinella spiralis]|uniref:hypothetical protein n=1 Tax=Trichinella spiralis TaxID=6334 RepID=UPI0001EFBE2E|nr:hypothetical protein Tsp_10989 [Trichinella spiralis]
MVIGNWRIHQMLKTKKLKVAMPLAPHCFFSNCSTNITSSAEFLWCSFCSGKRDKSCSHHFVLNLASQTSLHRTVFGAVTFPSCSSVASLITTVRRNGFRFRRQSSSVRTNPDNVLVLVAVIAFPICGLRHPMKLVPLATLVHMDIKAFPSHPSGYVKRAHFIHDSITLTSSEFDQTTLRQSSSAGARIDLSSVRFQCDMTKISNCGLRHPMNLVPFATRVHMDVKALPSRPSVPLLITNSQRRNSILFMTAMKDSQPMALSNCVYGSDVRKVTQESWHIYIEFIKSSRERKVLIRSIKKPGAELCKFSKKIPEGMPWA